MFPVPYVKSDWNAVGMDSFPKGWSGMYEDPDQYKCKILNYKM